jgi:cell shape-determining protein MreC|tara:strand:+ start:96 stop:305 length:210 start_codon:yes stop_codon:yes gene_type:complete
MNTENILSEGLIDKIISKLTNAQTKRELKKLSKAEKKHYDNAMKHFKKANDILKKNLKDSGIEDRFAGL